MEPGAVADPGGGAVSQSPIRSVINGSWLLSRQRWVDRTTGRRKGTAWAGRGKIGKTGRVKERRDRADGREEGRVGGELWPSASAPGSASGPVSGRALPLVLILTVNGLGRRTTGVSCVY